MLTLSTMTATPSTSKTLSSSLAWSKASAYWKPEQPPPRTATRRACSVPSACQPSSSPIFSAALSVRVIAASGVSVTSQSVAGDGGGPDWSAGLRIACELASRDRRRLRHDRLPPTDLVAERGIKTISLYVSVDGEQERESDISDYAAFYERLRASESGATTSQPSIGDFLEVYEPLLAAGREIVSIHISAGISGTFEAAGQARQRLIEEDKGGERMHAMDSRSAAGGMGLCALGASAAAAGDGADAAGDDRPGRGDPRRR